MEKHRKELNEDKLGAYYIFNIFQSKIIKEYPGLAEFVSYSRTLLPIKLLEEFSEDESGISSDKEIPHCIAKNNRGRNRRNIETDYTIALLPQNVKAFKSALLHYFKKEPSWRDYRGFDEIQKFWNLDNAEMSVLLFCITISVLRGFKNILGQYSLKSRQRVIMSALKITPAKFHRTFSVNSALRRYNIIDENYTCNSNIIDFLCNGAKGFGENMVEKIEPSYSYSLNSFGLKQIEIDIAKRLLASDKNCRILIYGLPGTGKTAFANSLAKELGKSLFSKKKNSNNTGLNFTLPCRVAQRQGGIALFDESDAYLETSSGIFKKNYFNKGEINEILDKLEGKSIWIVNSIDGIDESTRRRFTFSIGFKSVSPLQKEYAVKSALKASKLDRTIQLSEVLKLCDKYSLSPAGINLAIANAGVVCINKSKVELLSAIDAFASSYATLRGESDFSKKSRTHSTKFDLSIINADCDITNLLEILKSYTTLRESGDANTSMNLLFYGDSGTGKSELAKYIASELNCPLIVKKMSDILSKYVGEAERNIAAAFAEADAQNGVLLIDEADSIFTDRNTAQQNHEISKVNEILAQMDDYRGILICTTNMFESIDSAAMRRFQKKIKFNPLKIDGIKTLLKKYFFIEENMLGDLNFESLYGLCTGDFKNVYEQLLYEKNIDLSTVLAALKRELEFKNNTVGQKIGFC